MSRDRNGLEVLTPAECIQLLSTAHVGRIALSVSALPVVLPVNYAVMDDTVVLRSGAGTKLDAALAGAVVAFEVDHLDEAGQTGWSVMVQGHATVISEPDDLQRAQALRLRPWAGGAKDRFIKIGIALISGRRILSDATVEA